MGLSFDIVNIISGTAFATAGLETAALSALRQTNRALSRRALSWEVRLDNRLSIVYERIFLTLLDHFISSDQVFFPISTAPNVVSLPLCLSRHTHTHAHTRTQTHAYNDCQLLYTELQS